MAGPATRAPWRDLFASHLSKDSASEFTLSTISHDAAAGGTPIPRARTCGFRGFWPEPQLHPKAEEELKQQVPGGRNPQVYESDMLSFTTDVRMDKIHEMNSSGNVVEACFWLKDAGSQWRVRGKAFAVAGDSKGGGEEEEEAEEKARREIMKGMRMREDGAAGGKKEQEGWCWEREVVTYFANHTPVMRASFKSPPPGRPRSEAPSDPSLKVGQKVTDLHDAIARRNFRVVVIRPEEVERLDVSDYENPRRWKWTLVDADEAGDKGAYVKDDSRGRWVEVELWP